METPFFRRKITWYSIAALLVVTAVVIYFMLKPSPPSSKACYTISWDELNANLATGFTDPSNEAYIQGISFKIEEGTDPVKITGYYVGKDGNETGKTSEVKVNDPETCKLPELKLAQNFYHFESEDADASGRLLKFSYLKLIPEESTETDGTMVFKMEYVTEDSDGGEAVVRTAYTKPCPPYCPRPEL